MVVENGIWRQARSGADDLEWSFDGGSLVGLRSGDQMVEASDASFDLLDLQLDERTGRVFPPHFRFDPETGRPLVRRAGLDAPFGAPYLRADGLPDLDLGGRSPDVESRAPVAMPAGIVALFACGDPTTLFCLTAQGVLFFQCRTGAWIELDRLAPPDLPAHAFSVVATRDGFAGVFGQRLVVCEMSGSLPRMVLHSPPAPKGRPCGSPVAIENGGIAFPMLVEGRISIEVFWSRERRWGTMEVAGVPNASDFAFSVPVQVPSQLPDTYWVGAHSYILMSSDYGERTCEVRPFPDGVQAVLGPRPLRDSSNTLHVLVETQSHFAYRSLTRSPRTTPLSGPHVSAGQQSFFSRSVFETPWDEDPVSFQIEAGAGRILLPLAYDQGANGKNLGTLVALVDDGDIAGLFSTSAERIRTSTLHWQSGARVISLKASAQLRNRFDILAYRTDRHLIVGSAVNGAFYRWELE
ncbi:MULTISPECIES: hypothetical protein [unclassified Aureimonas]|uniref:hypothetical protein n=1 Tax=unclassified Aureimonas TaxID=2615206 RepID=UPI0006FD3C21|nr:MULTISPECIES: hypothetical protein [unclassified Aureimonas]KQT69854.1 hypothetical protein ASG62_01740 [Aureimonas sp. Leaf427]KQT75994.1 hypothetical protein ASG54_14480 [Aureimonas sp. Leaf460]